MITVDFDGLRPLHRLTGIERYTLCLANHFATKVQGMQVTVFTEQQTEDLDKGVHQVAVTGPEDLARVWLSMRSRRRPQVYHLPYFPEHTVQLLPLAIAPRSVLMVHDLAFFHFPYLSDVERERRLRRFELMLRWATAIVTNSNFTRKDVLNEFDIDEEKVEVAYPGVKEHFLERSTPQALAEVAARLELPERFFLTVGKDHPHKNLHSAVAGFAEMLAAGGECDLVMAGETLGGEHAERIDEIVRRRGLDKKVHKLGYVGDADLSALYQLAEATVFPSLHEGFGFPVLEAMVSGTPVVAVGRTSIPEVCGDAALLVKNGTASELGGAMKTLLENRELRSTLVQAGLERAKQFSWDATAEKTHKLYERILDKDFVVQTDPADREQCWEEFHLLSFAEIAEVRVAYEGVIQGLERVTGQ